MTHRWPIRVNNRMTFADGGSRWSAQRSVGCFVNQWLILWGVGSIPAETTNNGQQKRP